MQDNKTRNKAQAPNSDFMMSRILEVLARDQRATPPPEVTRRALTIFRKRRSRDVA